MTLSPPLAGHPSLHAPLNRPPPVRRPDKIERKAAEADQALQNPGGDAVAYAYVTATQAGQSRLSVAWNGCQAVKSV